MKAIVYSRHGTPAVLQLKEIDTPVPKNDEVLVKIHAGTVTVGDVFFRKIPRILFLFFRLFGFRRKHIPGHELAGEVEAVGGSVTKFKPGDKVYGTSTGLATGGNAEYICVPEKWKQGLLVLKPENIPFEDAAAMPVGGMTALHILRKADIKAGQKILIYGASGSVGTFAVQIAKALGAEVTGVCSAGNREMVKSLGADNTIDYVEEDFTKAGRKYAVVFDAVGKLLKYDGKHALADNGIYLTVKSATKERPEYLDYLQKLYKAGKVKPFIDKTYSLEEVPEAHRYVEDGHKKGNVVIRIGDG